MRSFAARPLIGAVTLIELLPAPRLPSGVREPSFEVVPYSKWYVVAAPRGLTRPVRVALLAVTSRTPPVATPGGVGFGGGAAVLNVRSEPFAVPALLVAETR